MFNSILGRRFLLTILLSAIFPAVFSGFLFLSLTKMRTEMEEINNRDRSELVKRKVRQTLSEIELASELLLQSPELLDYLSTKPSIRPYLVSRVTGRIKTVQSLTPNAMSFQVFDVNGMNLLGNEELSSGSELDLPKLDDRQFAIQKNKIFYLRNIFLDDQATTSGNLKKRGYLVVMGDVQKLFPRELNVLTISSIPKNYNDENFQVSLKDKQPRKSHNFFLPLFSSWLLSVFLIFLGFKRLYKTIVVPIRTLSQKVSPADLGLKITHTIDDIFVLESLFERYLNEKLNHQRYEVLAGISAQVAHDIRSPLAALNMVMSMLPHVEEDYRLLIRNSVQRINDIANSLLAQSKKTPPSASNADVPATHAASATPAEDVLIAPLLDALVSEKRIQFRGNENLNIRFDASEALGAFARVSAAELKRALSNLVNNSSEALPEGRGSIVIGLKMVNQSVVLEVIDDGTGMPDHVLRKLLSGESVTHGKTGTDSGSGLGVRHAREVTEAAGGKFSIESTPGKGTRMSMALPQRPAPSWFIERVSLAPGQVVVVLDDDRSIHDIWQKRLASFEQDGLKLFSFFSSQAFLEWHKASFAGMGGPPVRYLFDFELLGDARTGLDLIEECGLARHAILVTSRYDEAKLRERCAKLGVKLIPKGMAGFVPLEMTKALSRK